MNKNLFIGIGIGLVILGIAVGMLWSKQKFGGVSEGQGYYATSTEPGFEVPTAVRLKYGSGILGSVVIVNASAGTFKIYNATSTTDVASSTFVIFPANAAAGTYTFDAVLGRGIVWQPSATYNGDLVITWK